MQKKEGVVDKAYEDAIKVLEKCSTKNGFYAAYPGYDMVFARDSMIISLGASLLGKKFDKTIKASLDTLSKNQSKHGQSTERIALLLEWPLLWKHKGTVVMGLALMLLLFLSSLTWLFRRHLGVIVSTVFGVFLVASILLPVRGLPNGETLNQATSPCPCTICITMQIGR